MSTRRATILLRAVSMLAMVAGSVAGVAADDIDSLRLFFTPEQRQAVTGINALSTGAVPSASSRLSGPEAQSRVESGSGKPPPQSLRHARDAVTGSIRIVFNALITSADGVRVLLNGLPCSRVVHSHKISSSKSLADLHCPHLDKSEFHFRLQLTDLRVQVLQRGRSINLLSVGNAL